MFSLIRSTLLEKISRDNGWDLIEKLDDGTLKLGSARHEKVVNLIQGEQENSVLLQVNVQFCEEIKQSFPLECIDDFYHFTDINLLGLVLRRVSELSFSLPNTPFDAFERDVKDEILEKGIADSERIAEVKQRVGQSHYRRALEHYWQGSCAVTGISTRQVLRASHAKPWVDCETYEERLSVYNGFLLSANLDSLFDKGLIAFSNKGEIIVSIKISARNRELLGLNRAITLRWVSDRHIPFLEWHREKIFKD